MPHGGQIELLHELSRFCVLVRPYYNVLKPSPTVCMEATRLGQIVEQLRELTALRYICICNMYVYISVYVCVSLIYNLYKHLERALMRRQ